MSKQTIEKSGSGLMRDESGPRRRDAERSGSGLMRAGLLAFCTLLASSAMASDQATLEQVSTDRAVLTVELDGELFVGVGKNQDGYYAVDLYRFDSEGYGTDSQGSGSGNSTDSQGSGSGSSTDSQGSGSGESTDSDSQGSGSGDSTDSQGSGSGNATGSDEATDPVRWGHAEVIVTAEDQAEAVIYQKEGDQHQEVAVITHVTLR